MQRNLLSTLLIAAAFMQARSDPTEAAQYRPVVGEPHPDFVLPDIDSREPVTLSQFRGRKTILIHFASW